MTNTHTPTRTPTHDCPFPETGCTATSCDRVDYAQAAVDQADRARAMILDAYAQTDPATADRLRTAFARGVKEALAEAH